VGNTWVTNLRHYLDKDGNPADMPRPAEQLAKQLCSIVESVTCREPDDENYVTTIRCRRRPKHKRCSGNIIAFFDKTEPKTIRCFCPFCEDNGYITGWQETQWDKRKIS